MTIEKGQATEHTTASVCARIRTAVRAYVHNNRQTGIEARRCAMCSDVTLITLIGVSKPKCTARGGAVPI